MKVLYVNQQDESDPMNRVVFAEGRKLAELLDSRRGESRFTARLSGDNGFELMVGIVGNVGCAQFNRSDGVPPYLMAVPPRLHMTSGNVEFLMGGTRPRRFPLTTSRALMS